MIATIDGVTRPVQPITHEPEPDQLDSGQHRNQAKNSPPHNHPESHSETSNCRYLHTTPTSSWLPCHHQGQSPCPATASPKRSPLNQQTQYATTTQFCSQQGADDGRKYVTQYHDDHTTEQTAQFDLDY